MIKSHTKKIEAGEAALDGLSLSDLSELAAYTLPFESVSASELVWNMETGRHHWLLKTSVKSANSLNLRIEFSEQEEAVGKVILAIAEKDHSL